jgi:hypothetical protein
MKQVKFIPDWRVIAKVGSKRIFPSHLSQHEPRRCDDCGPSVPECEERPNWDQISAKWMELDKDVAVGGRCGRGSIRWQVSTMERCLWCGIRYRVKATDYLASARDQSHAKKWTLPPVSSVKKLNKLSKR